MLTTSFCISKTLTADKSLFRIYGGGGGCFVVVFFSLFCCLFFFCKKRNIPEINRRDIFISELFSLSFYPVPLNWRHAAKTFLRAYAESEGQVQPAHPGVTKNEWRANTRMILCA